MGTMMRQDGLRDRCLNGGMSMCGLGPGRSRTVAMVRARLLWLRRKNVLFFKKRTKKLLFHKRTPRDRLSAISKSFLLLFFKKEVLSSLY
jgi:hypothetical protein